MENLPRLGMALTLLYGGYLAIDGKVTVGTIITFSSYVLLLQAPFRMLGFFMIMSQRAAASAERIFEILDTPAEIVDRPGATDLVDPAGAVTFDDVSFRYGADDPLVLDDFDLEVRAGETMALVGGTGSGKSTVARILLRFYDADEGAVRIDGHDVRDLSMASLRHHVGMVTDEPFLFSSSIHDNIAYARPDATMDEVVAAAKAANAHGFILELSDGYDTVIGERGYTLSGGQRQRIAIARTLLADPAVLVLDDATSAVDVRVEAEIHEALERLSEDRTTIVIAHRLSTIALADRVAAPRGRQGRRRRHAPASCWPANRATARCWPPPTSSTTTRRCRADGRLRTSRRLAVRPARRHRPALRRRARGDAGPGRGAPGRRARAPRPRGRTSPSPAGTPVPSRCAASSASGAGPWCSPSCSSCSRRPW